MENSPSGIPLTPAVLVVDDHRPTASLVTKILESHGYPAAAVNSLQAAKDYLTNHPIKVVLCDINLGGESGLDLFTEMPQGPSAPLIVAMTGQITLETATAAIRKGAFEYLTKSERLEDFEKDIVSVMERAMKRFGVDRIAKPIHRDEKDKSLIGRSHKMVEVYRAIGKASMVKSNVLIIGETGTGKELIARAIHETSAYADRPFVTVNCGALTDTLLESELFGHARGSFTGAVSSKLGLFEVASGGTLFLDEIGDITPALQVKLLRAIQEGEIKPVGSVETRKVDVRVVAATHRNLEQMVKENLFREDLYYRLKVFSISVPPLRERLEDLEDLFNHFVSIASAKMDKPVSSFSPDLIDLLRRYSWPGNIRELENAISRVVASAQSQTLFPEDFAEIIREHDGEDHSGAPELPGTLAPMLPQSSTLADMERAQIISVLSKVNNRRSEAARLLGIDRVTLYRKIAKYGIAAEKTPH
ncbi:MAG: sigma-54-dependent Fis family transcriptional regulator [Deltaproteobacteria bacterium]|nr:sigma-54-dependent Fis family transcriptional regulator [Deltaproteobacteria bacterium]